MRLGPEASSAIDGTSAHGTKQTCSMLLTNDRFWGQRAWAAIQPKKHRRDGAIASCYDEPAALDWVRCGDRVRYVASSVPNGTRDDGRAAFPAVLGVEFLVVASVEYNQLFVDYCGVGQPRTDRVNTSFQGSEVRAGPRVSSQLAIIISDHSKNKRGANLTANCPFGVKIGSALGSRSQCSRS